MHQHIHIGAAALNTTPKDWSGNAETILAVIKEAKERGIRLLCLPELVTTGYGCEDEFYAPYVSEWALRILLETIRPAAHDIAVTIGLPIRSHGVTYNAIAVIVNAELIGFGVKQNLAGDGIHYEPRFFKAWPAGHVEMYDFDGGSCMIGDLIFEIDGLRVGFEICQDAWVANRSGVDLAQRAVDVILNPSASHFSFGKSQIRERFVQEGSRAFHCAYVYANLSGGADSAACLALVYLMAKTVLQENPQHPYVLQLLAGADATVRNLMSRICVCAYQGTVNSSDTTEAAARGLAEETGARFLSINVQVLVDEYEAILSGYLGRPLTWETDDISRQNIQTRCRAPGIWAIANASNLLLLSTSNRSEAAVVYCTMDGDTAGSLSPVAGIDKTFLRQWLVWVEQTHLPSLQCVNGLNPTAELRPLSADQTDEEDLMPYPILNRIQKLAVVEKKSPRAIFDCLQNEVDGVDAAQIFAWLKRYLSLWSRNQWKRERYAPSFHVDDENLDPRSWCRYPILSGAMLMNWHSWKRN